MSFIIQHQRNQKRQVKLVQGKEQGRSAWYILCVDKLKLPLFQKMMQTGDYNLPAVGTLLYSGWGDSVPEEILTRVKHDFA